MIANLFWTFVVLDVMFFAVAHWFEDLDPIGDVAAGFCVLSVLCTIGTIAVGTIAWIWS